MDWRYGGIISNKDSEIALAKSQRDDYRDKLSGATPDQAKSQIEALESRLAKIEPRHLTLKQIEAMKSILSGSAGMSVQIASEGPCSDCHPYAEDFERLFNSVNGWTAIKTMFVGAGKNAQSGVGIRVQNTAELNAPAALMAKALKAADIPFDLVPRAPNKGSQITIQINTKLAR